MANPTTNYGFVLPTSSDLVTDLPADFDVALQGVDTRLKALQPGTTLGDIAYSSATANTNTRLGIGTTGQVLTVAGGVPTWGTPSAGDTGPSFGVFLTAEMSGITANTWTKITFNGEDWDTNSNFASNKFTPTTAGYYQLNLSGMCNGSNTYCSIYKNGVQIAESNEGAANRLVSSVRIVYLNGSTDYVEGYIYTGGSILYSSKTVTYFSGGMIRSA